MLKARKLGVLTPVAYMVDAEVGTIYLERVRGESVKTLLRGDIPDGANPLAAREARDALLHSMGRAIAKLHDGGLIHGDLTTSNMLVRESDGALVSVRVAWRVTW